MRKILLIAQREFLITVSNKGFLFGLFILPLMLVAALFLGPRLLSASRSPQVVGRVAIMDPTGLVLPELRSTLSTPAIKARQEENAKRQLADVPEANRAFAEQGIRAAMGSVPDLTIQERPADAAVATEKQTLASADAASRPLALVVIHQDAVQPTGPSGEFGTYDLYASRALDDATETVIYQSLSEALVRVRLGAAKLEV